MRRKYTRKEITALGPTKHNETPHRTTVRLLREALQKAREARRLVDSGLVKPTEGQLQLVMAIEEQTDVFRPKLSDAEIAGIGKIMREARRRDKGAPRGRYGGLK